MTVSNDTCAIGGLINPDAFPVPDFDTDALEYQASELRTFAAGLAQVGSDIKSSWAGLSECYTAPEAGELYSVVDPVATDGESIETGAGTAATALETFAQDVRDLKVEWIYLKSDANSFLSSIEGDDDWREGSWDGESEKVVEHNELLRRASVLVQDYQLAEMNCANAINAGLTGRSNFVYGGTESAPNDVPYGYGGNASGMNTPWGGPVETDHFWTMDADHAVGDFLEAGGEDLSAMLGFDPAQNRPDWSWDTMRDAHWGNVTSTAALAGLYDVENEDWGWTGVGQVAETWEQAAHSVVPWTEWDERPGYVLGTIAINLAASGGGRGRTAGSSLPNGSSDSSGSGTDTGPRIDIPILGGFGTTPGGTDVDLPQSENVLSPSALADAQDAQDALERLIHRNDEEAASDTGSSDDPTTQDLVDGMTVEDLFNPASEHNTALRDEFEGDFLEADARGDGATDSWEASHTGSGSDDGGHDGSDENLVPALVGPRSDTAGGEGTPGPAPGRPIDLSGNGEFDPDGLETPGDRTDPYGADVGGRVPDVTNSVDNTTSPSGPSYGNDAARFWDELGGGGDGATGHGPGGNDPESIRRYYEDALGGGDGSGTTPPATPAPPPDPTAHYPGHLDPDGIRRFSDDADVDLYAQQVLNDPSVNPHAFDNLPPHQRSAAWAYTRNSWFNSLERLGDPAMHQPHLDRIASRTHDLMNSADPGERRRNRGWALYELNGLSRPTLWDIENARGRSDLTELQQELIDEITTSPYPQKRLDRLMSNSGYAGALADSNGGHYPSAADAQRLMGALDEALANPLPEGVQAVRGMHDINYFDGFNGDIDSIKGTVQEHTGYMSTSLGSTPTVVDGRPFKYVMHLDVPEGASGLWMGANSAFPNQRELILPRDTQFYIRDVREVSPGEYVIEAEVITN